VNEAAIVGDSVIRHSSHHDTRLLLCVQLISVLKSAPALLRRIERDAACKNHFRKFALRANIRTENRKLKYREQKERIPAECFFGTL